MDERTALHDQNKDSDFPDTWSTSAGELRFVPMDQSAGFSVRPGIYDLKGANVIRGGVNFTVHSSGGKSITLLLFPRGRAPGIRKIRILILVVKSCSFIHDLILLSHKKPSFH